MSYMFTTKKLDQVHILRLELIQEATCFLIMAPDQMIRCTDKMRETHSSIG